MTDTLPLTGERETGITPQPENWIPSMVCADFGAKAAKFFREQKGESAPSRAPYRRMVTREAYGAGSGVQDATTSWLAMIHRTATATGKSRFDTSRARVRAMKSTPQKVYDLLTQGPGQTRGEHPA